MQFRKILIIQTAFIGDVILATGILEKLHRFYPDAQLDILVRKGNEGLFNAHPFLHNVLVWDKRHQKLKNLFKLLFLIRSQRYDSVINIHRFASSGILTAFSKAKMRIGFKKNPFSFLFSHRIPHIIGNVRSALHEVQRNDMLIQTITDNSFPQVKLYPDEKDTKKVEKYFLNDYICIAPTSVWFTKQFPSEKWIAFIEKLASKNLKIILLGAKSDFSACENIKSKIPAMDIENLSGQLNLLQSAALMKHAKMNFVNDSAPLHLASAVDAPVTAIFCSTIPDFGFYPLSSKHFIVETTEKLHCRPCGLHGKKNCPQKHFSCAHGITTEQLLHCIDD